MSSTPFATENPIIVDLSPSYGALLIGCFLSCAVWGMTTIQVFWYFYANDEEPTYRRLLILFLWFLDIAGQVLVLKPMWPVLISQWGRVAGLSEIRGEMVHHAWIIGVIAATVQIFYLYRIYCYNGKKWFVPVTIGIIALYQPIVFIPYYAILHENYVYSNLSSNRLKALNVSLRGVSAVVDIFTAAVMSYYLYRQGMPKFSNTRKMYMRLFILTINTGLWTAIVATADLLLMVTSFDSLYYCIFEWPLSSLYLSVLLVNLNSRKYIRGESRTNIWNEASVRELELGNMSSSYGTTTSRPSNFIPRKDGAMVINIQSDFLTMVDKPSLRDE